MALKIGISSYVSGGYTNPVIWRLYETGSGVFVDDHQELGPHGVVYNFDFVNNIRDIVYTVKMYEQPGGTGIGTLIKAEDITVTTSTVTSDGDIETIVDGGNANDPVSTTSRSPAIASLIGKDYYVVQRGVGQRREVRIPEITINNDGSYSLLSGETFVANDTWIIKIRAQYVINPPGSQGIGAYKDVKVITSDYTVTSSDFGKLLLIDASAPVCTLQLPDVADIITNLSLWVRSVGVQNYVVIKAFTGQLIKAIGTTSNTFIMSRSTESEILNVGGTIYAFTDDVDIKRRGQLEWAWSTAINRIYADGSEYNVADYPGLVKAIQSMRVDAVCTYTQWLSSASVPYTLYDNQTGSDQVQDSKLVFGYQAKFAISDDGTKFRVPDLRNRFIRALANNNSSLFPDANRYVQGPGGYQIDSFKKHYHTEDNSNNVSGFGKVTTGNDPTEGPFIPVLSAGGNETRGENIGLLPLIIL